MGKLKGREDILLREADSESELEFLEEAEGERYAVCGFSISITLCVLIPSSGFPIV